VFILVVSGNYRLLIVDHAHFGNEIERITGVTESANRRRDASKVRGESLTGGDRFRASTDHVMKHVKKHVTSRHDKSLRHAHGSNMAAVPALQNHLQD
jgi:hypothetical protein